MTEKKRNLFVARTPLQCFNAIEARDRFHKSDKNYLLVYYGSETDRALIAAMLDDRWQEIRFQVFHGLAKFLYGWKLHSWLQGLKPVQVVYIGLITHVPLHVANVLQPCQLRLIDDGNETLLIARYLQALGEGAAGKKAELVYCLLGLRLDQNILLQAESFSIYDTAPYGIPRIVNDYRVFRGLAATLPERKVVMFVGSNLVGTYFRDETLFLERLARVKRYFSGHELMYCPHRYETPVLRGKIAALGFALFEPETIMERAFMHAGWRPALLASFRSTAVDTLGLIYGTPGCMLEIGVDESAGLSKWQEMRAVWEDFQVRGGRVVGAKDY